MQTYAALPNTTTLINSRPILTDRDDSLRSSFSGTSFPGTAVVGQKCYRTDLGKMFVCTNATGPVFEPEVVDRFSFRNVLANGDMAIDQRGAGNAVNLTTSLEYKIDRWAAQLSTTSAGTLTTQRIATAFGTESRYAMRIARSAGSYTGSIYILQVVETANAIHLAGKKVILSFKARKGSALAAVLTAYIVTGTGTDQSSTQMVGGTWTGYVLPANVSPTLTTSFQTFSVAATLGSSVSQIGVQFNLGAFSGSGGANDYLDIADIQIEECDVTSPRYTPFERVPIDLSFVRCQRYYEKSYALGTAPGGSPGAGNCRYNENAPSANCVATIPFKVQKRGSPTLTLYDGGGNSGKVSYYDGTWKNNGTPTASTGYDSHMFLQTNIASSVQVNWEWVADAEL